MARITRAEREMEQLLQSAGLRDDLRKITAERDQLRAEVERLRVEMEEAKRNELIRSTTADRWRPPMRSKEEALAKPLAGDRWGMGGNEFIIRKFARGRIGYYNSWLRRTDSCPLGWFETWATNAEYLGGAE